MPGSWITDFVRFQSMNFSNPWAYVSDLSWTEYRHNCTNTLPPSSWVPCCKPATVNLSRLIFNPQVSLPCPFRNTCSSLGSHWHHSSFIVLFLWQRVHTPFQGEDTWDPTKANATGGKSFQFSPRSIILFIHSLILSRLSRSRTWHVTCPTRPLYVLSCFILPPGVWILSI